MRTLAVIIPYAEPQSGADDPLTWPFAVIVVVGSGF